MATVQALGGDRLPNSARLSNSQAGEGPSANIVDRGAVAERPALLTLTTTVGETPTCTYAIEGSADGTHWFPAAYADPATPETPAVDTFDVTTAGITHKLLRPGHPWRFLRLTYSANTAVTNTADITIF